MQIMSALSKYMCEGQISLFDSTYESTNHKPGEYVDSIHLGQELSFDEITREVGNLIVMDCSTVSHAWYKIVMVERIHFYDNDTRRLIYYDGKRQRGLVDERYFDKSIRYPSRAWRLK